MSVLHQYFNKLASSSRTENYPPLLAYLDVCFLRYFCFQLGCWAEKCHTNSPFPKAKYNGLLHMLFFADRYKRIMEYLQRNEALFSQLRKKACSINQPRMTSSPFQSLQLCTSYHALQLS
ncbi:unnamed protein product [Albugo candida]|uniref:Uncharacterized protein n=1 Tax=Albugo candida TaxID=65357 RepID=A0A024FUN8_9STRA|nr:unnamed protein product [Albugo candida]|eukprot:CCI10756.1 unnamed protein product [Albugo candida]